MKKTLTVNLGGTVFHIDEDAYQLLDKYLSNLRIHFNKEEGADEIMSDFELRISEILSERVRLGNEVITIEHVENVIERMGKVEELFGEDNTSYQQSAEQPSYHEKEKISRRFFRNPDDRILGGVCSGFAAYMGWDPTPIRLLLFILIFIFGVTVPIYLILWLIVPMAYTATEKLQMRGESVTVENIGKTVTDSFEKVSNNVNEYIHSDKPRSTLQRLADGFVQIVGILLKVLAVLVGIILFPVILLVLFVLFIVMISLFAGGLGLGFGFLNEWMPSTNWDMLLAYPEWMLVMGSVCTILLIGIPVLAILYAIVSSIFNFKPLPKGVNWAIFIIWVLALGVNIFLAVRYGIPFWGGEFHNWHWSPSHWRTFLQAW